MPADKSSLQAKRLLHHYLEIGFRNSGYRWDADNTSEVNEIVDSIIDACTPAGSPSPSSATPSIPSTQSTPSTADPLTRIADALERIAAQSDWIELSDCWVRRGDIYRVDTGYQQNLFFYARHQEGTVAQGQDLGDVLAALGIDTDR